MSLSYTSMEYLNKEDFLLYSTLFLALETVLAADIEIDSTRETLIKY